MSLLQALHFISQLSLNVMRLSKYHACSDMTLMLARNHFGNNILLFPCRFKEAIMQAFMMIWGKHGPFALILKRSLQILPNRWNKYNHVITDYNSVQFYIKLCLPTWQLTFKHGCQQENYIRHNIMLWWYKKIVVEDASLFSKCLLTFWHCCLPQGG